MVISAIYHGEIRIGEAEIVPVASEFATWNRDIRISHFSPPSERCPPLAVLHTVADGGVCFKARSELPSPPQEESQSLLFHMHSACLREKKTAVMLLGDTEIHLVAMACRSSFGNVCCFWGFSIPTGLYNSCLVLLNLRCLGLVFDLDETLVVANTSRSFEDKIDALQRKINSETDPLRASIMLAEVKRYQDDRFILKQYTENDHVLDNGLLFKAQLEVVPSMCDGLQQPIVRPVIRLHERNIILTRINPSIRDTSVLVRLRPGWDDLRSYLTARGRKRFEVYVCTMAERDYALEMWRLLDPESNLINAKQLLDRIVCVKSGSRKSLINVFQNGICHPKLALVIDDRLKVWDDVDQRRVHVVPAFAPYYAPHAEANIHVPVLCVARNVACSVRASFFKAFDENLLPYITTICSEDDISDYSFAPDVGNYFGLEEDSNGNKDPLPLDMSADFDTERRIKEAVPPAINNVDSRVVSCLPNTIATPPNIIPLPPTVSVVPLHGNQIPQIIVPSKSLGSMLPDSSIQGSPVREEGEVPENELDPDTRRRLLILQHGQDTRDLPVNDTSVPARPLQVPVPPVQSHASWFSADGEISPRQLDRVPKEYSFESGAPRFNKKRYNHQSFFRETENHGRPNKSYHENSRFPRKTYRGDDPVKTRYSSPGYEFFPGDDIPSSRFSSSRRNAHLDFEQPLQQYSGSSVEVLCEIASKCGTKVEFKTFLGNNVELQFGIEVWFAGDKIGGGLGRTRKEAQLNASENSLKILADRYISISASTPSHGDKDSISHSKPNGILSNSTSSASRDGRLQLPHFLESRFDGFGTRSSVSALKELCTSQGFRLTFQAHSSAPTDFVNDGLVYAQVEVSGEVLGKGTGTTWEEAKSQAAEEALENLNSSSSHLVMKRSGSPRPSQTSSNKRSKGDLPRSYQRFASGRY